MAVPKRKTSKARRDKRRSSHWKLETPALIACPNAGPTACPTGSARPAEPTTAERS
jgi:large subunit ribosomal protein L32